MWCLFTIRFCSNKIYNFTENVDRKRCKRIKISFIKPHPVTRICLLKSFRNWSRVQVRKLLTCKAISVNRKWGMSARAAHAQWTLCGTAARRRKIAETMSFYFLDHCICNDGFQDVRNFVLVSCTSSLLSIRWCANDVNLIFLS